MKGMPQKFQLKGGENVLEIHGGLCGAHIGSQAGSLCLWTTADLDKPVETVKLYVAVTGEIIPVEWSSYLGTALLSGGGFVVHVYHMSSEVKHG